MTRLGNLGLVLTLTVPLLTLGAQEHAPARTPGTILPQINGHRSPNIKFSAMVRFSK